MNKTKGRQGKVKVTFTLPPAVGATQAAVCGDWNGWVGDGDLMIREEDGGFRLDLQLPAGEAYRFRYLLDGHRWENDWEADAYLANDHGSEDSVVDLTSFAVAATPIKKAPAKKVTAAKKSAKKA